MALNLKIQPLKLKGIIIISFLCLLFGHLVIKAFFPNPVFWLLGFIILFIIFSYVLIKRKDEFSFILILFFCSHFMYANNQGGLWNLLSFIILLTYILFVKKRTNFLFKGNPIINFLIWTLVICNFFGLIINNPMPLISKLQGSIVFLSYIFMFYFISNQLLTPERLKKFILLYVFISIYMFLVCINDKYLFVTINSPLFGRYSGEGISTLYMTTNSKGLLGSSPILGEYSILTIALFIPLLISFHIRKKLHLKISYLVIFLILSFVNVILSNSRSVFILTIFVFLLYFVIYFSSLQIKVSSFYFVIILVLLFFTALSFGNRIGLDTLFEKLEKLEEQSLNIESILSGESINRSIIYEKSFKRIKESSWILGYGYGTIESNRLAWFGTVGERFSDPHSLYLAIIMIYGWIGSIAFILLIISTILRLLFFYLKYKNRLNYLAPLFLGFIIFWIIFLINEYKINMLMYLNYHMLFWIWLGFSYSVINSIKYYNYSRKPGNLQYKNNKFN